MCKFTKFKSLHRKAKIIDGLIERNYNVARQHTISLKAVGDMVLKLFPDFKLSGSGLHKIVFEVRHGHHLLVFKIGRKYTIENDHKAYNRLPVGIRRKYFARIYWHTNYCLLQEYGEETYVSVAELNRLKEIADKFDLIDIGCENIRRIDGRLKIIDANIVEGPMPILLRIFDSVRYKHPWLYKFVRSVFFVWILIAKQK